MIKWTGAVLCLLAVLAGCGGSNLPASRLSTPNFTGPVGSPHPTHTVTVAASTVIITPSEQMNVKTGAACPTEGGLGRTMTGRAARCVKRTGESAAHWVLDVGAQPDGTVKPGRPCPAAGAIGTDGVRPYECLPSAPGSGHVVWTAQ